MWIVRIALERPYTFIVLALLILIVSPVVIARRLIRDKQRECRKFCARRVRLDTAAANAVLPSKARPVPPGQT